MIVRPCLRGRAIIFISGFKSNHCLQSRAVWAMHARNQVGEPFRRCATATAIARALMSPRTDGPPPTPVGVPPTRGLHSSTLWLNVTHFLWDTPGGVSESETKVELKIGQV